MPKTPTQQSNQIFQIIIFFSPHYAQITFQNFITSSNSRNPNFFCLSASIFCCYPLRMFTFWLVWLKPILFPSPAQIILTFINNRFSLMHSQNQKQYSDYQCSNSKENESSFEDYLCIIKEKKIKSKLRKDRIRKLKNKGSWTPEEEAKFVEYIRLNRSSFEEKDMRRKKKIFRLMSKFLGTRSSQQCRSHHQKYQLKFITLQRMFQHIQKKLQGEREVCQKLNQTRVAEKKEKNNERRENTRKELVGYSIKTRKSESQGKQKFEKEQKTRQPRKEQILQQGSGYKILKQSKGDCQIRIIIDFEYFLE